MSRSHVDPKLAEQKSLLLPPLATCSDAAETLIECTPRGSKTAPSKFLAKVQDTEAKKQEYVWQYGLTIWLNINGNISGGG